MHPVWHRPAVENRLPPGRESRLGDHQTLSANGMKRQALDSAREGKPSGLGRASKLCGGRELLEHFFGRARVVDGDPVITDGTGMNWNAAQRPLVARPYPVGLG